MRILNRVHIPWFIFVVLATLFATWVYVGNFAPQNLPGALRPPPSLVQKLSDHRSVGGTPVGLIFGTTAFAIFIFAGLLGARKKVVLWRIGTLQRWMRAHIWLTLLTIPLVILHSGFRFGGPMTTLLVVLYLVVMVSGIYGLVLQHQMPRIMMERLPAESVYEQIPHIRAQLHTAAQKMRDSFKPVSATKTDSGAPAGSAAKVITAGSTPMASTAAMVSTPTARAKTVVGSTITAEAVGKRQATPAAPAPVEASAPPAARPPETMGTPTARVPEGTPVPSGGEAALAGAPSTASSAAASEKAAVATAADPKAPPQTAPPAPTKPMAALPPTDAVSETTLVEFLDRQILPYLAARNGKGFRLGNARVSEDTFRFLKLRVTETYRTRVTEMQAWCDERRMLDLQVRLQHWLHGWLFVHVPISFVLLFLTAWHAIFSLFYYG
jgi:hypothetical protein